MADSNNNNGIGFAGLLTVAFVVLKLCDVIAWPWWWVLSPLWITAIAVASLLAVFGFAYWMSN